MSKTILTYVDGWTPIPDLLVTKYGMTTAIVWGAAWRYCQMSDGVCKASMEKIAKRAGVSRQTAQKHMTILVEDEFFEDMTPNLRNKPHIYRDTGKVAMYNRFGIGVNEIDSGVNEIDSDCQPDIQEESIKETKKDMGANAPKVTNYSTLRRVEETFKLGMRMAKAPWESNKKGWQGFPRWLLEQEEAGHSVSQFCKWFMSDAFRAKTVAMWSPEGRKGDGLYSFKAVYLQAFDGDVDTSRAQELKNYFDNYQPRQA